MGYSPEVIQYAIVTYARSWSSLAAVRSLGRRGVRVVCGDTVPLGAATFSKYCESSFVYHDPSDEKRFINDLVKQCERILKTGAQVLLLPIHEESYVIAKHVKRFPRGVHVRLMDSKTLGSVQDKGAIIDIAKKHEVSIPESWLIKTDKQAKDVAKKIFYPVFMKRTEGSGSLGVKRIDDEKDFFATLKSFGLPVVVQESIPGKDYCVCALYEKGRRIALFTYTALQTYPSRGGTTVYRQAVSHPEMEEQTHRLLSGLKWTGVAEVDFRVDSRNDEPIMIEVNPRFWGGLNQAVRSNVDFPYLLWRMAQGVHVDAIDAFDDSVTTGNVAMSLGPTIQELMDVETVRHAASRCKVPTPRNISSLYHAIINSLPFMRKQIVSRYKDQRLTDDVFDPDDKRAMAGILFPLAVFAKHGKINAKLLVDSMGHEKK